MTVCLDVDLVLENILKELGSGVYFLLITSENGVIIKSYISDEFNKSSIGLNISQLYELAEEVTSEIGIHSPDFNVIHSDNFYILSIKILEKIIVILMEDQIDFSNVFNVINACIKTN